MLEVLVSAKACLGVTTPSGVTLLMNAAYNNALGDCLAVMKYLLADESVLETLDAHSNVCVGVCVCV